MGKLVRDNSVRTLRLPTQSEDEYLPYSGYEHIVPAHHDLCSIDGALYEHIWPYAGFYCRKCFHPIIMKIDMTLRMEYTEPYDMSIHNVNDEDVPFDPMGAYTDMCFNISCPKCGGGSSWNQYLDPAITPAIAKLNQKGYKTVFSCQGHNNEHDGTSFDWKSYECLFDQASNSSAYIAFNNYWMEEVIDNIPLFGPWKGERNPDWVSCYEEDDEDPIKYTIRCPVLHDNLAERIVALDAWVSCLPDISSGDVFIPDKHITQKILDKRKNMVLPILKKD